MVLDINQPGDGTVRFVGADQDSTVYHCMIPLVEYQAMGTPTNLVLRVPDEDDTTAPGSGTGPAPAAA
jgi:hypothetical protein